MKTDTEGRVAAPPSFTFLAWDHRDGRMDAQRAAPGMRSDTSQVGVLGEASCSGPAEGVICLAGREGGEVLSRDKEQFFPRLAV